MCNFHKICSQETFLTWAQSRGVWAHAGDSARAAGATPDNSPTPNPSPLCSKTPTARPLHRTPQQPLAMAPPPPRRPAPTPSGKHLGIPPSSPVPHPQSLTLILLPFNSFLPPHCSRRCDARNALRGGVRRRPRHIQKYISLTHLDPRSNPGYHRRAAPCNTVSCRASGVPGQGEGTRQGDGGGGHGGFRQRGDEGARGTAPRRRQREGEDVPPPGRRSADGRGLRGFRRSIYPSFATNPSIPRVMVLFTLPVLGAV